MNTKKTAITVAICCLGSLAAINAGRAALTSIQITAVNGVSVNSYAYNNGTTINSTSWAGYWSAKIVGGATYAGPYDLNDTFTAFCTDIGNANGNSGPLGYQYEARAFSSAPLNTPDQVPPDPDWANALSGQRAAWIYNTYVAAVNTVGNVTINSVVTSQAERISAMCISIWESLYEGSGTFNVTANSNTGRSFKSTGSNATVLNLANYWLAQGAAAGFAGFDYTWWAEQQTPDVQSLVGPNVAVPEPTTIIAGALLLLPFGASTLRVLRNRRMK